MKKSIGLISGLFILGVLHGFAQQAQKPNILFIAVDDLKPALGFYGDKLVKTPKI